MPWETLDRLVGHYGIAKRDAETLLALDEYDLKGVEYFEEITGGEARLGKRAVNWYALQTHPSSLCRYPVRQGLI